MNDSLKNNRPLSPHLQVYKIQITSLLSILHRFTGMILYGGAVFFILWLLMLAQGPQSYEAMRSFLLHPGGLIFLMGLSFSFFYHLCNGIRHLCWDMGVGYELSVVKKTAWAVVLLSFFFTSLTWLIGFMDGKIFI
jgi:succinate dehydrogenase / fumarate reductase cytochrome b subunit